MHPVVQIFFIIVVLFMIWEICKRILKCSYCGGLGSHEDHCPWRVDPRSR